MPQSDPYAPPPDSEIPPEAAQIITRARRSFGISIAILICGFIAIGGALVYRATRDSGDAADRYVLEAVMLPAGASVVSVSVGDGLVTVTYRLGEAIEVRIVDGRSGETVDRFGIVSE